MAHDIRHCFRLFPAGRILRAASVNGRIETPQRDSARSPLGPLNPGDVKGLKDPEVGKKLAKKPLVEALVEIRWELVPNPEVVGLRRDPAYPLFLGPLQARARGAYPHVERLPAASIPDEASPHVVKFRFRKSEGGWPLIQAGPGIATLNFTDSYDWDAFLAAAREFFSNVCDSYIDAGPPIQGSATGPRFTSVLLRYINAYDADVDRSSVFALLKKKFNAGIELPKGMSDAPNGSLPPSDFQLKVSYRLEAPRGTGTLSMGLGKRSDRPALIWELSTQSENDEAPQNVTGFEEWLQGAHEVMESWFFSLVHGELEAEFLPSGE